jgi:hypothetical protein
MQDAPGEPVQATADEIADVSCIFKNKLFFFKASSPIDSYLKKEKNKKL